MTRWSEHSTGMKFNKKKILLRSMHGLKEVVRIYWAASIFLGTDCQQGRDHGTPSGSQPRWNTHDVHGTDRGTL